MVLELGFKWKGKIIPRFKDQIFVKKLELSFRVKKSNHIFISVRGLDTTIVK